MHFTIATLLSHLSEDKLVAPKALEKKLDCPSAEESQKLQIALDALERIGVIEKDRGKYKRVPQEATLEARLRCSSKGFCFAIQDDETAEDIYVRESHLGSAWNGDRVLVRVTKEGSRRRSPEGEVQVILERANPSVLAQVQQTENGFRAVPLDDRLLFELELLPEDSVALEQSVDKLVHVEVARYPLGDAPPQGRVTRILGSDAEEAADTDIVCCKHDLRREFPEAVEAEAAALPDGFASEELERRRDLRDLLTVTLEGDRDGETVENAFSLERLDGDRWRAGIHLADVARLVEPESAIAREALRRGTTVVLGEMVLPLLPAGVVERCALVPGADRIAYSILLDLDDMGALTGFEIVPSVVRVDRALSYPEAQTLLGRDEEVAADLAPVAALLKDVFFTVAPLVKAKRIERGAFELQLAELLSPFKDEGRVGAIASSPALPVRALLAELCLLANWAVAQHLTALGLPGIYRTQTSPDWSDLDTTIAISNNLGLDLAFDTEADIRPQDYQTLTQQFAKTEVSRVLVHLARKTLKLPKYASHPGVHFGLAYDDGYSPCVAPARRYADLLVQQVLRVLFEEGRDRRHSRAKEGVNLGSSDSHGKISWNVLPTQQLAELEARAIGAIYRLNDADKLAEDAETDFEGLRKAELMKERTGQVFPGTIVGVQNYGFFVELEDLLVEGLVHVSSLKDDWYEYRSRHDCLVGRKNRIEYRLGSRIQVQVKSVDYYRQQIDLVTVLDENATDDFDEEGFARSDESDLDYPNEQE